jgi:hypothetical protein
MAMTDFSPVWLPASPATLNGNLSLAAYLLNASGERAWFVIQCPKAGTLDWFEYRTSTVVDNPDNGMQSSFQTVDPATGFPDGVVDQFRDVTAAFASNTWITPPGVMTDDGTNTGVKRTVTRGEWLACVINFVSFTAGDAINIAVLAVNASSQTIASTMYPGSNTSGSDVKDTTNLPILALKYADGTYAEFDVPIWPLLTLNSRTFNSGSTPDERALRLVPDIAARSCGAWVRADIDGPADVVLYDAADAVLASYSLDPEIRSVNNGVPMRVYWSANVAAAVNRLSLKPTSGTNIISYDFDVPSAAHMACVSGGAAWYGSTRTDAGAWTDTTTQRPLMGLIFDGFDVTPSTSVGGAFTFVG